MARTFLYWSASAVALAMAASTLAAPVYPPFGLDLSAFDHSVRPGDDFFAASNDAYLKTLVIPADQSSAGRGRDMGDRVEARLRGLLDAVSRNVSVAPADTAGKVGAMYAAFMDEAAVEAAGATPIAPELAAIHAARDPRQIAALMGQTGYTLFPAPFVTSIDLDLKATDRYAVYLGQSGLLLPDRDYYLKSEFAAQREAYRHHAATLLKLVGWTDPDAAAAAVLAFETQLATVSWTNVEQRDLTTQYNPMTPGELAIYAPGFDWPAFIAAQQLGGKATLVATTNTALPKLAAVVAATPLITLQAWLAVRVADQAAPYLSRAFADAYIEFHGKALAGQTEQKPRWKRGILAVSGGDCEGGTTECFGTLGWAVGDLYTAHYFPAADKAKIEALVGNLKAAFRTRIERLDWMGPATKVEALKKLDTYIIKVGYPDHRRDYSNVVIRRDDLLGDVRRAAAAEWAFQLGRSDGPVDRSDWGMTPQTVDAYNGSLRDIVFPAGILQAPYFDAAADPAVNYGGIGGVIGHEMTHGFDDQGRSIDSAGALRDWWTPADAAAFKARAAVLGAQYATYEPLPGVHINPDLTMGENLADLGGLAIALDAYHASLHGALAPVLAGLTGDQRVFLGWAQGWAGKAKDEAIREQVASDPHSFRKYRVNGVVRNIDGWYAAFGIKPGDALYVSPDKRARIW
ncbi:peptidase M13 (plasmid) [Polymorphobacter sp. PAMC 29334]|uniref:M13 family metallopeptidase n=1 Tax=Polymorphobacter sp. PAMC 29334 TaxID=2862331 RepID=UPI001C744776|nr:M13-type metalloendopeptidase [Polymorphobacter sp. PAMC 29334]QYE33168.1 peptidase M13 [Polymorphobacter sp. PAMC 29334]